jgi:alpha-1,4-digalacturonate transport system substrate-binding protein
MFRAPALAAVLLAAGVTAAGMSQALAGEIRIACYSDGNECESTSTLAARFMKDNPDIKVTIDQMSFKAIQESLPVQLAAGQGPDIARTTDFGPIARYLFDLTPYLPDAPYWETNFGSTLDWMRTGPADHGIYGLMTQLTISAPLVNKTLFDQAGVPIPKPGATWDQWADAVKKVQVADKLQAGMAWDRSGARLSGPMISMGAKFFAPDGTPAVVDDGFKAAAAKLIGWSKDGTFDKDVYVAAGGGYRDAFEEFANGRVAMYLSGSWQLTRLEKQIGDGFEWVIGSEPCGSGGCTGMPGGAGFVAFKTSKNPKDVARFLDFLAQKPVYAEMSVMTSNVPAQAALQKEALPYKLSPAGIAAIQAFGADAALLTPLAYRLQGAPLSRPIFNAMIDRISQAMSGQITLEQAEARITSDVADAAAAVKK